MADDVQQDAPPVSDGQVGQGQSAPEQPADTTAKTEEEIKGLPDEYLDPDTRNVERATQVWKQYIGVQYTGPVYGGQAYGAGTTTVAIERTKGSHDGQVRGRIRASDLERIRVIHIPAEPAHTRAREILNQHGLVVLHGRARWGKTTTALRLLDEKHRDEVYMLDPEGPFPALEEPVLEAGRGYLVERLVPDAASAINPVALMHLSERLVELSVSIR